MNLPPSPFASFVIDMKDDPEFSNFIKLFEKEDDDVIARRKYTRIQLKIQRKLSKSKSIDEDSYKSRKINKNHLNNDAGILMVDRKKPFNVRFDLDRNETF